MPQRVSFLMTTFNKWTNSAKKYYKLSFEEKKTINLKRVKIISMII